jgi:type IX secretion system PorP/SprF family membrane protein
MKIKKISLLFLLSFCAFFAYAQQLPFFTQFVANDLLFNPAIAGTKRTFDFRLSYRNQWLGFEGAPKTEAFSLNYSLLNKMGIAAYGYEDVTGFTKRTDYTLCYAFQIHFSDLTLSFGLAGSMVGYTVDGSQITTNQTLDPAIDRAVTANVWAPDASAGAYLFNDKWRFGISTLNLVASSENFYKTYGFPSDTSKAGALQLFTHFYTYLGYIYGNNENITWQNSVFVNYTGGAPIFFAYDLKCYIKSKFIAGLSIRLNDAIAIEAGIISHNSLQICYSYDYVITELNHYTSGSQEIVLIYSIDKIGGKGGNGNEGDKASDNNSFKRRKYGYMF